MTRSELNVLWDRIRVLNGITVRCVANLPAGQLDSHPIPKMRTPKELVVHTYSTAMSALMEGLVSGTVPEVDEAALVRGIKNKDELLRFCDQSWKASDRAANLATDAQLQGQVKTPWGHDMSGTRCADVVLEELLHHRGQLYVYLRAMGQEVPDAYDFANNAPEFQRRAPAQA
jgi:uncharacterized damage-inducible protein DinB